MNVCTLQIIHDYFNQSALFARSNVKVKIWPEVEARPLSACFQKTSLQLHVEQTMLSIYSYQDLKINFQLIFASISWKRFAMYLQTAGDINIEQSIMTNVSCIESSRKTITIILNVE